jgi:hypothetical protein
MNLYKLTKACFIYMFLQYEFISNMVALIQQTVIYVDETSTFDSCIIFSEFSCANYFLKCYIHISCNILGRVNAHWLSMTSYDQLTIFYTVKILESQKV